MDGGPVRLHEDPAIRLLVVRDSHHIDVALQVEEATSHGKSAAPLTGTRESDEAGSTFFLDVKASGTAVLGLCEPTGDTPSYL